MVTTDVLVAGLSVWTRGSITGMMLPAFTNSGTLSMGATTVTDLGKMISINQNDFPHFSHPPSSAIVFVKSNSEPPITFIILQDRAPVEYRPSNTKNLKSHIMVFQLHRKALASKSGHVKWHCRETR